MILVYLQARDFVFNVMHRTAAGIKGVWTHVSVRKKAAWHHPTALIDHIDNGSGANRERGKGREPSDKRCSR